MFWPWALPANENGHSGADGYELADGLVPTLETAGNVDVVPPNRTLEAVTLIGLDRITSRQEAMKLPGALDVRWVMRAATTRGLLRRYAGNPRLSARAGRLASLPHQHGPV